MNLYELSASFDDQNGVEEYFGSKEAAVKRAAELKRNSKPEQGKDARRADGNGLCEVEVYRFKLARMGFKEAVLAALNKTRFIAGGSRERVYHWERKG